MPTSGWSGRRRARRASTCWSMPRSRSDRRCSSACS
jgi:hypothetical protein